MVAVLSSNSLKEEEIKGAISQIVLLQRAFIFLQQVICDMGIVVDALRPWWTLGKMTTLLKPRNSVLAEVES